MTVRDRQSWTPDGIQTPRCEGVRSDCEGTAGNFRFKYTSQPRKGEIVWLCRDCLIEAFQ